jgi:hypothetical protein
VWQGKAGQQRLLSHGFGPRGLQIAAGVGIAIVRKRLRHSSFKITNDTYGHLIGTVGGDAAEAAAALVPLRSRKTA